MPEAVPDVSQARVLSVEAPGRCMGLMLVISVVSNRKEGRLVTTIPEGLFAEFID